MSAAIVSVLHLTSVVERPRRNCSTFKGSIQDKRSIGETCVSPVPMLQRKVKDVTFADSVGATCTEAGIVVLYMSVRIVVCSHASRRLGRWCVERRATGANAYVIIECLYASTNPISGTST